MTHNGVMVTTVQEIVKYVNIERRTERKTMTEHIEREKAFDAVFGQFCASSDETEAALNAAIEEIRAIPAADVVPASDFRDCRNELCLKCGAYTQKHNGSCDGCRWQRLDDVPTTIEAEDK